jgi:hypothetical protein
MQLDLFGNHNIISNQPTDTKECKICKEEKDISEFYVTKQILSNHKNKDNIKVYHDTKCKVCCISLEVEKLYLRKKHRYPDTNVCDCCGVLCTEKLVFDHCHDELKWRGWLCRNCNTGIGMLGDNISGLKQAIKYLNKVEGR